jgi:hypothetical protein
MKKTWLVLAAIAGLALAPAAYAETQTWFGFSIGIQGGSPQPRPIEWRTEPSVVWVGHVAVVDRDACYDDVFRCSGSWWRMSDGWWYRSSSWRGPWTAVDVRRVPRSVLDLPATRWKHHPHGGPPGQMKKSKNSAHEQAERSGRGDGDDDHGKGRGHDRS